MVRKRKFVLHDTDAVSENKSVRTKVVDGLSKSLQVVSQSLDDALQLARDIEQQMFDAYGTSEAYKERFRMLHFNLKQARHAEKIVRGEWTPAQLVKMSSEEFVDESLRQERAAI